MKKRAMRVLPAAIALAMAGTAGVAQGSGFQLMEQNASGLGNAYAGQAATAQDASTVFWNPAGMTRLPGRSVVFAANAIRPSAEFNNTGSTPAPGGFALGGSGGDGGDWALVPNAYLSWQINPQWFVGVGLNAPFGLTTDYDSGWMGRFYALKSELKTINVNPSVAFKVSDSVSLGFGINFQYADAELTNATNWTVIGAAVGVPVAPGTEGVAKIEGDDTAWGFNVGAMFNIGPQSRVGVSYRSAMDFTISGSASFTNRPAGLAPFVPDGPVSAGLDLPATASLSFFHNISPKWELMGDLTWTEWSRLDSVVIRRPSGAALSTLQLSWRDTWRVGIGANYHVNNEWTLRLGTAYDQSPTKDEFRTPRIPDGDRWWLALGGQYRMSKQAAIDFGYAYLIVKDPSINLTPPNVSAVTAAQNGTLVGNFDASVHIFSAQFRYSF